MVTNSIVTNSFNQALSNSISSSSKPLINDTISRVAKKALETTQPVASTLSRHSWTLFSYFTAVLLAIALVVVSAYVASTFFGDLNSDSETSPEEATNQDGSEDMRESEIPRNSAMDEIRALAQAGVNLSAQDEEDYTRATRAAENGHADVIRALAEAGVDLNAQDGNGHTPATMAAPSPLPLSPPASCSDMFTTAGEDTAGVL